MPIRSLLSETGFNSDQTEMAAKAFADAWAELQGGLSEPAMSSLIRTSLAKRIIEMAQRDGMTAKIGNSTYGCMTGFARLGACTRPRAPRVRDHYPLCASASLDGQPASEGRWQTPPAGRRHPLH
jgi:hypothetical protein